MLDHSNRRCLTYGDGATCVQARHGHPALRELQDAGSPVETYRTQAGAGIGNRPQIVLIPMADWDALAARQRGQGPRPTGVMPTPDDLWEDRVSMLYEDEYCNDQCGALRAGLLPMDGEARSPAGA